MDRKKALRQLSYIKNLIDKAPEKPLLAAEGWDKDWKTLISIILSAQTRDTVTIEVCRKLFYKYPSIEKLSKANILDIQKIIKHVNYHKTKSKNIKETASIIHKRSVPETLEELIKLPGVGRKTANVFLAGTQKAPAIGVDTHVARISIRLNWTNKKFENREGIEKDLEKLFPKKYRNSINTILVTFGQIYGRSKKKEELILENIKKL